MEADDVLETRVKSRNAFEFLLGLALLDNDFLVLLVRLGNLGVATASNLKRECFFLALQGQPKER